MIQSNQISNSGTTPPRVNATIAANPGDKINPESKAYSTLVAVLSKSMPLPEVQKFANQTMLAQVLTTPRANGQTDLKLGNQTIPIQFKGTDKLPEKGQNILVFFQIDADSEDGEDGDDAGILVQRRDSPLGQVASDEGGGVQAKTIQKNLVDVAIAKGFDRLAQSAKVVISDEAKLIGSLVETKRNSFGSASIVVDAKSIDSIAARILSAVQAEAMRQTQKARADASVSKGLDVGEGSEVSEHFKGVNFEEIRIASRKLTDALAGFLRYSVQKSGIFYESHLKDWVKGSISTPEIKKEFQNRFALESSLNSKDFVDLLAKSDNSSKVMPLPKEVASFVGGQLSTLHNERFELNISGLFGSPIHLEIDRDQIEKRNSGRSSNKQPVPWNVRLRMELPKMGAMDLNFRFYEGAMTFSGTMPKVAKSHFESHWPSIQASLDSRGVSTTSFSLEERK